MMAQMTAEPDDMSDAYLAGLAAGGDRASFSALVERHYDFIYRVGWRLTGNREAAEDVAQDVCIRLGQAIRGYRAGSAFTTWLYAIVLNAVRDEARKRTRDTARTQAYLSHALIESDSVPEPDSAAERMWEAVRFLPDKQCQAVSLVYGEEMTHADAAELMGCSEATVSWHIHEAKKRLKTLVSAGEA
jgi:RNA polymerase sigma-70 factor (ECF subfamily)